MKVSKLAGRKIAVFDAEIKKRIEDCSRGWDSHDEMGVSVLVIFDYATMRYRVFDDRNCEEAISILKGYELVVGFNTVKFDWKLIKATWPVEYVTHSPELRDGAVVQSDGRISRDFDILREMWLTLGLDPDRFNPATHGGYKLDDVAFDTLGMRKTSNGALAPIMFQEGRIAELIDYCIEDVRIERTLFEFVVEYGYVLRGDRIIEIDRRSFPEIH
jgi:hypothetical protein